MTHISRDKNYFIIKISIDYLSVIVYNFFERKTGLKNES